MKSTTVTALLLILLLFTTVSSAQLLTFRQVLERPDRPQPDHKIAYSAGPQQYGELWLPRGTPGPHPVVILIHGGCWRADLPGPELVAWQAEALRKEGVAVWSMTYRRLGHDGGGYPGTFQDAAAGADHLRQIADKHRLDLKRVVATGHSAGGHLALWIAARRNLPASSPLRTADPLLIHGVAPVAGIPDLAYGATFIAPACGADTMQKLADEPKRGKDAWADTSPALLLPLGVPQLMLSGVYDVIVPPVHAKRHQLAAAAKGDRVTLRNFDEAGHFEIISPWTDAGKDVVKAIAGMAKGVGR